MQNRILVYGTKWCGDCLRTRRCLDNAQIEYDFIDIDKEKSAAKIVMAINQGNRSVPTIIFPDKTILVEPSNEEILEKIKNH